MRTTAVTAALLSAVTLGLAQNQTFNIQVGAEATDPGGIFQFIPSNITAPVGSTITFTWKGAPGNHTVTQMTAENPCQPVSNGFDSGFLFIPMGTTSGFPTWNITITNDSPIYFYCAQLAPAPHCTAGMVGSINAPLTGNASWEAVWTAAQALNGTNPGQPTAGAPLSGVNVSITAAPGPVPTTTGGIMGVDLPGGSASGGASGASGASGATSGSASGTSSGSGAPSPSTTTSGAMANAVGGLALFLSAVFGTLLL